MKITHVIESSGGSADFVLSLVKNITQHEHQIIYGERTFGNKLDQVKSTYSGATFFYWKYIQREIRIIADIKATISLYKLLRKIDSDVIHLHSSKAGFIGRLVCYLQRKNNVVYTPNGLAFLRTDVSYLKIKLYILLERVANWLTGKVVGCSKSEAQELTSRGIDSVYINNGTEIFNYKEKETGSKIIVATTGRVTIQKNPVLFNEIAKKFERDQVEFVWIGGGEMEDVLTSKNIYITGWLDRASVLNEVSKADIYLSTASWEGLPFAVLEAMNLSKPLLLTNCVGNIDLVENNHNGFVYNSVTEAVEKLNFLNQNKALINSLGKSSRRMVADFFSVGQMSALYEKTYHELASNK